LADRDGIPLNHLIAGAVADQLHSRKLRSFDEPAFR
jgi:hypothetical protein